MLRLSCLFLDITICDAILCRDSPSHDDNIRKDGDSSHNRGGHNIGDIYNKVGDNHDNIRDCNKELQLLHVLLLVLLLGLTCQGN